MRAVAVDGYRLWLETLVRIAESAGVQVVGTSTRFREGIELLEREQPDIFLLGLERGGVSHAEAGSLLLAASEASRAPTIVVSSDDDPCFIGHCLATGAVAYLLKTIQPDDLCSALGQVVDRCVYLFGAPAAPRDAMPEADELMKLTQRELEVLRLVAEGCSNAEVAKGLWISVATVKFHLSSTYEKLGVANRTGAVSWAHQHGLLGHA